MHWTYSVKETVLLQVFSKSCTILVLNQINLYLLNVRSLSRFLWIFVITVL